jgi:hypothetical protein
MGSSHCGHEAIVANALHLFLEKALVRCLILFMLRKLIRYIYLQVLGYDSLLMYARPRFHPTQRIESFRTNQEARILRFKLFQPHWCLNRGVILRNIWNRGREVAAVHLIGISRLQTGT